MDDARGENIMGWIDQFHLWTDGQKSVENLQNLSIDQELDASWLKYWPFCKTFHYLTTHLHFATA